MTTDLAERILARVRPDTLDGCWRWPGARQSAGYGLVRVPGSPKGASPALTHRVMYEAAHGPIPAGLVVDHLCRVRECCNPWHMEAVSIATNTARGLMGQRIGLAYRAYLADLAAWEADLDAASIGYETERLDILARGDIRPKPSWAAWWDLGVRGALA